MSIPIFNSQFCLLLRPDGVCRFLCNGTNRFLFAAVGKHTEKFILTGPVGRKNYASAVGRKCGVFV